MITLDLEPYIQRPISDLKMILACHHPSFMPIFLKNKILCIENHKVPINEQYYYTIFKISYILICTLSRPIGTFALY